MDKLDGIPRWIATVFVILISVSVLWQLGSLLVLIVKDEISDRRKRNK